MPLQDKQNLLNQAKKEVNALKPNADKIKELLNKAKSIKAKPNKLQDKANVAKESIKDKPSKGAKLQKKIDSNIENRQSQLKSSKDRISESQANNEAKKLRLQERRKKNAEASNTYKADIDKGTKDLENFKIKAIKQAEQQTMDVAKKIDDNEKQNAIYKNKAEELTQDIEASGVDPDRWMRNRSTGQTVAYLFASALYGSQGNIQVLDNAINAHIQRDINAQLSDLGTLKSQQTRTDRLRDRVQLRLKDLYKTDGNIKKAKLTLEATYLSSMQSFALAQFNAHSKTNADETSVANAENIYNNLAERLSIRQDKINEQIFNVEQEDLATQLKVQETKEASVAKAQADIQKARQAQADKIEVVKTKAGLKPPKLSATERTLLNIEKDNKATDEEVAKAGNLRNQAKEALKDTKQYTPAQIKKLKEISNKTHVYRPKSGISFVQSANLTDPTTKQKTVYRFNDKDAKKGFIAGVDEIKKDFANNRQITTVLQQSLKLTRDIRKEGKKGIAKSILSLNKNDGIAKAKFAVLFAKLRKKVLGARPSDKDMELIEGLLAFNKDKPLLAFSPEDFADLQQNKFDTAIALLGDISGFSERADIRLEAKEWGVTAINPVDAKGNVGYKLNTAEADSRWKKIQANKIWSNK